MDNRRSPPQTEIENIERLAEFIARKIVSWKPYISQLGAHRALERLEGPDARARLARMVAYSMSELGYDTKTDTTARKAIRHVLGA